MSLRAGGGGLRSEPKKSISEPGQTWRNYNEVFDLMWVDGQLVAATNGGLLRLEAGRWSPVDSPAGMRQIVSPNPLSVVEADGRTLQLSHGRWQAVSIVEPNMRTIPLAAMDDGGKWSSFAKSQGLPIVPYCAARVDGKTLVGTPRGLFGSVDTGWELQPLPGSLPVTRPNGLAEIKGKYVIGGLDGLYLGHPGAWTEVSHKPVRQVLADGDAAWIVYGSGAVDKIAPASDQLYPDVFYGATRRPWASCAARVDGKVLFGGNGGWVERGTELTENYPKELDGDVVMAIAGRNGVRWIGTQKSGLFEFNGKRVTNWNPGNGLDDTWVTSLCLTDRGLVVGTATKGLFLLHDHTIRAIDSPTQRVTHLEKLGGKLFVGGMDGAWVRDGNAWSELPSEREETTALSFTTKGTAVVTASGVHFWTR